jgi:predicted nuclease of predicted toxin-antitoxin system
MALRFLADHCVSKFIIDSLRKLDHQVVRLHQVLPMDSADSVVIEKAQELDALLLTLNGDFADIVRYPPAKYKGIIALQVHNHPEVIPHIISRLVIFLNRYTSMDHYSGKLLLVEADRIRVRE